MTLSCAANAVCIMRTHTTSATAIKTVRKDARVNAIHAPTSGVKQSPLSATETKVFEESFTEQRPLGLGIRCFSVARTSYRKR